MHPWDDAVDYVANLINEEGAEGIYARWWCLDNDFKEKYRVEARKRITAWADKERGTKAKIDAKMAPHLVSK